MLVKRLGTFLSVIGLFILLIFAGSLMVDNAQYDLFFVGLVLLLVGFLGLKKEGEPTAPNNRFSLIRRFNRKDQEPRDQG